jgi:predicted  nucleic acid-binding Zn-ribbon protein
MNLTERAAATENERREQSQLRFGHEGASIPGLHFDWKAEALKMERERDEAILERDEMRRANITGDDEARPLGQSVEYWQDRALDHATHMDRAHVELVASKRQLSDLRKKLLEWATSLFFYSTTDDGSPEMVSAVAVEMQHEAEKK